MRFVSVGLLVFVMVSCTGERFYKYCNVRIENQTGSSMSEIVLLSRLGASDSESYTTSFEDVPGADFSGYKPIRCVSAVAMLMGNSSWTIISRCSISYRGSTEITNLVFEADTGTGNLGRALLQPDQNYTIVVSAGGAVVSSP